MGQFNWKRLKIFAEWQFIVERVMYVVQYSGKLFGSLWWTLYVYISQSVALYTGYVLTEHEGNKNIGQYYS